MTARWSDTAIAVPAAPAALLVLVVLLLAPVGASAAPQISSTTVYYTVRGTTPHTMLTYMLQNGPHGGSGRALGTTSATISQNMNLEPASRGCLIRNYRLKVAITMSLPRLAAGQTLSAPIRAGWNGLAAYVRTHENRHKTIFAACASRIDRRIRALGRNRSCSAIRATVRAIFNEENSNCDRAHQSYDQGEASRIRSLPFILHATSSGTDASRPAAQRRTTTYGSRAAPGRRRNLK